MNTYLFRFGYTWPDELDWNSSHPDADLGEASAMLFVCAGSEQEALMRGRQVADAFVLKLYGGRAYPWTDMGFAAWVEDDASIINDARDAKVPVLGSLAELDKTANELVFWSGRGRPGSSSVSPIS